MDRTHHRRTSRRAVLGTVLAMMAGSMVPSLPAAAARPSGIGASITFTPILSGYQRPVMVTNDGLKTRRIFIVEQVGRIRVARYIDGAWKKQGVFLNLTRKVNDPNVKGNAERGLLGLAFDPDYASNGRFYVNYTRAAHGDRRGDTVIAEYHRITTTRADPHSERVIKVINQPEANHNGGDLAFGPDGYLYIGMGDGGGGGDVHGHAQNLDSLLGKLLRIDPHDPDGAGPRRFAIPRGNPYIGEHKKRPEIWASGLRNPWRYSFDRGTGDLVIGDVGQNAWEEVDWSPATGRVGAARGANFGWNVCEGDTVYPLGTPCDHASAGFTGPVFVYSHDAGGPMDGGCAVVGGYVFRGPGAAAWRGIYLFGDLCGKVSALAPDGTRLETLDTGRFISSFGEDVAGRLYLAVLGGSIMSITFTGDPTP